MVTELEGVERIHLMGMGGAGMASLAKLLSGMGFQVSGFRSWRLWGWNVCRGTRATTSIASILSS